MKRKGNLYKLVYDYKNLYEAYIKARKGKGNRYGVKLFNEDIEGNLKALQHELKAKTYKTSPYSVFKIYEPKEREIYRLPFRDRVIHHAIMNIIEPLWVSIFTADTFSCIKKRGIHGAERAVIRALENDPGNTVYCLKGDIRKFYPSIDHDVLKEIVRRKIKDPDLLELIDGIIDSAPGVPIGNYLSQYLANLYLAYFDHDIKRVFGLADNEKIVEAYLPEYISRSVGTAKGKDLEEISKGIEYFRTKFRRSCATLNYYFRYADDWTIFHKDKVFLGMLVHWIALYFGRELKLKVKDNWQVFPVDVRGVDFVGYVFRYDYVLLRKSIKKNLFRKVYKSIIADPQITRERLIHSVCSYYGWALHCDSINLMNKVFNLLDDESKQRLPKSVKVRGSRRRNNSLQF